MLLVLLEEEMSRCRFEHAGARSKGAEEEAGGGGLPGPWVAGKHDVELSVRHGL